MLLNERATGAYIKCKKVLGIFFFCFASVKASCRIGGGQMVSREKHAGEFSRGSGDYCDKRRQKLKQHIFPQPNNL